MSRRSTNWGMFRHGAVSASLAVACGGASPPAPPAAPIASAEPTAPAPPAPAATPIVSAAERRADRDRWASLGLRVRDDGPVLPDPFAEPLTRRSFVVPAAWFEGARQRSQATSRIDAAVVRADIDVLERVMAVAYGGWDGAAERGFDWESWWDRWRAMLEAHGDAELAVSEAFAPMKELLSVQLDNHTNIPLGLRLGSGSASAVLASEPRGGCDRARSAGDAEHALDPDDRGQQPKRALVPDVRDARALRPVHYIAYPQARGDLREVRCGGAWIPVTPAYPGHAPTSALAQAPGDVPSARRVSDEIVLVRLPTFSKQNAERLVDALPGWPVASDRDRVLVVDLRDNDGGDAAFSALERWLPFDLLEPHMTMRRTLGASCAYHGLRWGYATVSSLGLQPPISEGMQKGLQYAFDQLYERDESPCERAFQAPEGGAPYMSRPFDPTASVTGLRVLVLVNRHCGSDCEYMTSVLRALPGTVVAGTNTFGVMQFIQPGYSVLPHSRLPFRIALGTSDAYGDERSVDGYGLDVDVLLPTEQHQQPHTILALAERLAKGGK